MAEPDWYQRLETVALSVNCFKFNIPIKIAFSPQYLERDRPTHTALYRFLADTHLAFKKR